MVKKGNDIFDRSRDLHYSYGMSFIYFIFYTLTNIEIYVDKSCKAVSEI